MADSKDADGYQIDNEVDQATDLPQSFELDLQQTCPLLTNIRYFPLWLKQVRLILKAAGLEKLIDIGTPRPKLTNPSFKRWVEFSHRVRLWLVKTMSKNFAQQIASGPNVIEFADDFIGEAMNLFDKVGKGIHADLYGVRTIAGIQSIKSMIPVQASEAIWNYKESFEILRSLNVMIAPYLAFCLLLCQLETPRYHNIHARMIKKLEKANIKDPWTTFRRTDFHVFCFELIMLLDMETELFRSAPPHTETPPINTPRFSPSKPRQSNQFNESRGRAPGIHNARYGPPNGMDGAEFVQSLMKAFPTRMPNGKCPYCGMLHNIESCYYLNPAIRPMWFKPFPRIWMYEGAKPKTKLQRSNGSQSSPKKAQSPTFAEAAPEKAASPKPKVCLPKAQTDLSPVLITDTVLDPTWKFTASEKDWLILPDVQVHICADRSALIEYKECGRNDDPLEWDLVVAEDKKITFFAMGTGKAKITLKLEDGSENEIVLDCYYQPGLRFSLFSVAMAQKTGSMVYAKSTRGLYSTSEEVSQTNTSRIGRTVEENNQSFLQTTSSTIKENSISHLLLDFD